MDQPPAPALVADVVADVADAIVEGGIDEVSSDQLNRLVALARDVGAHPVLIAVLLDPTEPSVARERAFARLAACIVGRSGSRMVGVPHEPSSTVVAHSERADRRPCLAAS